MKKRLVFIGILVLILFAIVSAASAGEIRGTSGIKFQIGLPVTRTSAAGFYSRGCEYSLQNPPQNVPIDWSIIPTDGGPALTITAKQNQTGWAVVNLNPDNAYPVQGPFHYTIKADVSGVVTTFDTEVYFVNNLPKAEFDIMVQPISYTASDATAGATTGLVNGEMFMKSGTDYLVTEIVDTNETFTSYSVPERGWGFTEWEEKYTRDDSRLEPLITKQSCQEIYKAKATGKYDHHDYVAAYHADGIYGSNLAYYMPYTLYVTDESGKIPATPLENGNSTWTWYTGLGGQWPFDGGLGSDTGIIQFRIPEEYWQGPEVGLPQWKITNNHDSSSGCYDFSYEREAWNDGRGIGLKPQWLPKDETVMGENTYTIKAEYNGQTFESTEIIRFVSASYPTDMALKVYEINPNTGAAGAEIPYTDGGFTLEEDKDYLFSGSYTGNVPATSTGFWLNGENRNELSNKERHEPNELVYTAWVPGVYNQFQMSLSIGMSNLVVIHHYNFRIADEHGNIPTPGLGEREVTWYTGLPASGSAGNGGIYSVDSIGQMWFPDELRDYTDLNIQWEMIHQSGPDNFTVKTNQDMEWIDSYFYAEAKPKSGTLTPGDSVYTMRATYGGKAYEGTLTIHTVALSRIPTGMTMKAYATDDAGSTIGDPVAFQDGDLTVMTGKSYYLQASFAGSMPDTDASHYWINSWFDEKGAERKERWNGEKDDSRQIYNSNTEMLTVLNPGYYDAGASLTLENTNMEAWTYFKLKVTDEQGNLPPEPAGQPVFTGWFGIRDFAGDLDDTAEFFVNPEIGIETVSGKMYSTSHLFTWEIANMDVLKDVLEEAPVFEVIQTGGNVKFRTETFKEHEFTAGIDAIMNELPEAGNAVFQARCTIGDKIYEQTVRITFTSITGLPAELEGDFSNPKIMKAGDSFPFKPEIRFADGWFVGDGYGTLYGAGNEFFDLIDWKDQPQVKQSGIVDVPLVAYTANLYMEKTVRYIFTEADGTMAKEQYLPYGKVMTLPAGTKKIDSEAFAKTKVTEIDVPAGVEIADDAFADSGLVAVYTHNDPDAIEWAVNHGVVAVTE